MTRMEPFCIPSPYDIFKHSNGWVDVKFRESGESEFQLSDIFGMGPFFKVSISPVCSYILFAPSLSLVQAGMKDRISLKLQFLLDPKICHTLTFRTPDERETFVNHYLEAMNDIANLAGSDKVVFEHMEETMFGLIGDAKELRLMDFEFSVTDKVINITDADKKKKSKKSKHIQLPLTIKMTPTLTPSAVYRVPQKFSNMNYTGICFRLLDMCAGVDVVAVTPCAEKAMKWILAVHFMVQKEYKRVQKPRLSPVSLSTLKSTEPPKPAEVPEPEPEPELVIEMESVVLEVDDIPAPIEIVEEIIPEETRRRESMGLEKVPVHDRKKVVKRGKITSNDIDSTKSRLTFLPDGQTNVLDSRYSEFMMIYKPLQAEEVVMPELRTLAVTVDSNDVSMAEKSVDFQLESAFGALDGCIDDIGIQMENILSTDDIIDETLEQYNMEAKINFDAIVNFNDFPAYDRIDFVDPMSPNSSFVNEMMTITETLKGMGTKTLSYGNPTCKRLLFLIASLLLNGLKGFTDLSSTKCLIPAMSAFEQYCSGFDVIVDRASKEPNAGAQASVIAAMLFNTNYVVPFLKQFLKHDAWIDKYYHVSALVASQTDVEMTATLLNPIMNAFEFMIDEKSPIMAEASEDDIYKYVTVPAFGYLEMSQVTTEEQLVKSLSRQLDYGMKVNKNILQLSMVSQDFRFISEVAAQKLEVSSPDWKEFVEQTKALTDGAAFKVQARPDLREVWLRKAVSTGKILPWLMYLILSKNVVLKYYNEDSSMADPFRANYIVRQVARFLKLARN